MRKQKKSVPKAAKTTETKTKPVKKYIKHHYKPKKQEQPEVKEAKEMDLISQQVYRIEDEGLSYKVHLHKTYTLEKASPLGQKIKNWFHLYLQKQKRKNKKLMRTVQFSYYPYFQFQLLGEKPSDQKCSICQFQYEPLDDEEQQKQLMTQNSQDLVILKCSHLMHFPCFEMLVGDKQWIKCPVCSTIFGKMIGDQPPGTMSWNIDYHSHCEGFPQCGTINISYQMHAGKRGNISFPGTYRHAYLPDNKEGHEVLKLLKEAFDRKLIFTVGRSVTTGRDNQIVWNGIHHKTNLSGGSAYFGYPDPTYFDRVKLQLAAKGVY